MVIKAVCIENEHLILLSTFINSDNNVAPRLEMAPEFLTELLARLIDSDVELSLSRPHHMVDHS